MLSLSILRNQLLQKSATRKVGTASSRHHGITTTRSFFSATTANNDTNESERVPTLNKTHLARMIAEKHEISYAKSTRILNSIFDIITEEVAEDKKVSIAGFGYFKSLKTKERMGRHPITGESIHIPAKKRVKFGAFSTFKGIIAKP